MLRHNQFYNICPRKIIYIMTLESWRLEKLPKVVVYYRTGFIRLATGREPWSSGYGRDSCSKVCGFKTQHRILDRHLFVVKCLLKKTEINEKGAGEDHLKKDWPRILHSIEVSPPRQLLLAKENYSISFFNLAPRFESEFKNRIFWLGAIHQQRPAKKRNWKNFHLKKFLFSFFHWRRRAVWPDWAIFESFWQQKF